MWRCHRLYSCAAFASVLVGALAWLSLRGCEISTIRHDRNSLRGLPYAGTTSFNGDRRQGVTRHIPERVADGINVYTCTYELGAKFLDLEGKIVAELQDLRTFHDPDEGWELVQPYLDDGFLVLIEDRALFRIDSQCRVLWELRDRFHHDMAVTEQGEIYALRNRVVAEPRLFPQRVLDNLLVRLSATGETLSETSLLDLCLKHETIRRAIETERVKEFTYGPDAWDLLHTNTIAYFDEDVLVDGQVVFQQGQILVCMRHLDLIAVIDSSLDRIVWHWGLGELDNPHHPSILSDGHLLVFDNGTRRGYSRVLELDPVSGSIAGIIATDGSKPFFTATRGSAQRLPNGNTLIVEGERGRTFELTPQGEMVWEFFSFASRTNPDERELLYRMPRWTDPKLVARIRGGR